MSGRAWPVAAAGLLSLAIAMGIGRFAFTPLMPMMLHERLVDLPGAGWLASANYLGYLAGAVACTLQPWIAARLGRDGSVDGPRWVRRGLVATVLLTLAMALPLPALWPLLRFSAGVASAVVFVYTSGWCLAQLALRQGGELGGAIYAGPGLGIVVSGLAAGWMVAAGHTAAFGWTVFGVLAALLTAAVWTVFRPAGPAGASSTGSTPVTVTVTSAVTSASANANAIVAPGRQFGGLVVGYGFAGFGYIVTATFLPVIARQALPGSAWIDLFWPIFGASVFVGALSSSRLPAVGDRRLRLAAAYAMQAAGILVSLAWPSLPGFVLGSVLLGVPFTAITFFAMQEIRRLRPPHAVASAMGMVTAAYGVGQIVGPMLVAELVRRSPSAARGFDAALLTAASVLVLGVLLFLALVRAYPLDSRST